jgi:uncharacterized protein
MPLPVTAFVAAVCAIMLLVTTIATIRTRLRLRVAFGDGGEQALVAASRAHGNLAENAPIVILLLGVLELAKANHMALMVIGAIFLLGRVAHIFGMFAVHVPGKAPVPRQIGVAITLLTLAALSGWALFLLATLT